MKIKNLLLSVLFAVAAINANAGSDGNKTINNLGIQASTSYYFSVKEGLSTNCLFGVIYVPINEFGKGAYSLLLLAKASDKKIGFDYSQDPGGACFLNKLDLQ